MQVKDIMTRTVEVINLDATLDMAGERMRALDIGVLPVEDGDELVGVITDRDMAVRAISHGLDPKTASVREVMTPDVVSCFEDQSLEEAAAVMAAYRIRRLVVLNRAKRLVGIISLDDVAAGAESPALAGETLVRTSSRSDRTHGYRRILVALDGSKFAERVLPCIEPLAEQFGSMVTLIQVIGSAEAPLRAQPVMAETAAADAGDAWPGADASSVLEEKRAYADNYLTSVSKRLEARGLRVQFECPEGEASEVILRRARQLGADLIAISTQGRTGVDRMLFGSVAEEVLRRAPCPVLLVRVYDG